MVTLTYVTVDPKPILEGCVLKPGEIPSLLTVIRGGKSQKLKINVLRMLGRRKWSEVPSPTGF